jgi:hypothetical protein
MISRGVMLIVNRAAGLPDEPLELGQIATTRVGAHLRRSVS